ncbi:hypothetical protein IFM53868_07164 [Aspergillus udagawae]|uniref:Uncharacterized protein n=1 Tax=Aspergillus udagawae TaxID=91492 RepID=A0ABQ1B430_9EURO|nr:hypothetical protein IFM53868_07164 [Aspergillus udagawae]
MEDIESSQAWQNYPASLQHLDLLSESVHDGKSVLKHVQAITCSEDESYMEELVFGVKLSSGGHQSPGLNRSAQVTVLVLPVATGSGGEDKLSLTADDLQALLHEFQVSANVLYPLFEAENLGVKLHNGSNGTKKRAELWFTLPFPDKSDQILKNSVFSTLVWLDYSHDTDQARLLLFKPPSELLTNLRRLEKVSGHHIQRGYEMVLFLLSQALARWFSHAQLDEFYEGLSAVYSMYDKEEDFWGSLQKVDERLLAFRQQISALECLMIVVDFLSGQSVNLGTDKHNDVSMFKENLAVKKHRLKLLMSKIAKIRERVQERKTSMLSRPIVSNGGHLKATKEAISQLAQGAEDSHNHEAEARKYAREGSEAMKKLALITTFYLPCILVAGIFCAFTGRGYGGFVWQIGLYCVVAGPLATLTCSNWSESQYSGRLSDILGPLFARFSQAGEKKQEVKRKPSVSAAPTANAEPAAAPDPQESELLDLALTYQIHQAMNQVNPPSTGRAPNGNARFPADEAGSSSQDDLQNLLLALVNKSSSEGNEEK